jgi:uncharacterized protein DUF6941
VIQIDYLLPAESVAEKHGKLRVDGILDRLSSPVMPAVVAQIPIVARLRIPWSDLGASAGVDLDLVDAAGRSVLPAVEHLGFTATVDPSIPPGEDHTLTLQAAFRDATFPNWGEYAVVARIDGQERARTRFRIGNAV